ncbi:protein S40-1-like [Cornus florida]|uniref:protein S40-1-like n=1 Tax=Cornus florida TaxID=4283 RepID=UPI00289DD79D|nr:protein S40-1-like [Cornus florida]
MGEEFQESEVIFPENTAANHDDYHFPAHSNSPNKPNTKKKKNSSLPVNIRQNVPGDSRFQCVESDSFDNDGEMVPPHVIVGRRIAGKMEFSVCTGNGRTLKGRDLSQVRNSILRMTGFLET